VPVQLHYNPLENAACRTQGSEKANEKTPALCFSEQRAEVQKMNIPIPGKKQMMQKNT